MILIPIGHEESAVRRLPWVTFGVMSACLLALLLSGGASRESPHDAAIQEAIGEAFDYYFAHPYLELGPEFEELVDTDGETRVSTMMEVLREARPPPDPRTLAAEQQVLDGLVARVLDSYDSHPYMRLGLVPGRLGLLAWLTHMFMHAGWIHLIGNMLILYLVGPYIEDVWGRPLYLGFYLASGIAAAAFFLAASPAAEVPLVGASGAIAGLMGAFLVRYSRTHIRFFYIFGLLVRGTFSAPAWLMLPLWLVQQLFMAAMTPSDGSQGGGVAYWAHIGGFVFGAAAALAVRRQRIEERFLRPAIERKVEATVIDNPAVERALAAHGRGEGQAALRLLLEETRRSPANRDAALALWNVAADLDRAREAGPAVLRLIQQDLRTGDHETALGLWGELCERVPDLRAAPDLCVRLAEALAAVNRPSESVVMLRRAMLEAGTRLDPATALRIARLARPIDPQVALGALRVAMSRPELDAGSKHQLETMLSEIAPDPVPIG